MTIICKKRSHDWSGILRFIIDIRKNDEVLKLLLKNNGDCIGERIKLENLQKKFNDSSVNN